MRPLIDLVQRLRRRTFWQALGIYILASWGVLQVVDTLASALGLPEWLPSFALVLLLLGLPVVLATAFVQGKTGRTGVSDAESEVERAEPERAEADAAPPAAGPLASLLTWKNAVLGGVGALALWGLVAAGWLLLGGDTLTGAAGQQRTGVAVLPFANVAEAGEGEAFVTGIHDDVLTHLSKVDELRVVSRTSVMKYRDTEASLPEIADELGVGFILEGSIQRSRDRVRLNAQLIDARSDEHVWAEIYDRTLSPENVFSIQSELARSIASALDAELTPEEERRIEDRPTDDLAAYDLLNRGRELYAGGAEENETAVELFRQAIRMDPDFALARAWLSNAYGQRVQTYGFPREWADSGVAEARRALEINPELAEGWKALGLNLDQLGRLREGRDAYLRALEIEPSYATPIVNLAATAGFLGECHRQWAWARRAVEVDPNAGYGPLHVGMANVCLERFEEAEEWSRRALEIQPGLPWAHFQRVLAAMAEGATEESLDRAADFVERAPQAVVALWAEAMAAHAAGRRELARERYEEILRRVPEWDFYGIAAHTRSALAEILLEAGEAERARTLALDAIERAEAAVDRGDELPAWRTELAAAHAVLGERERALDALERAAEAGEWRSAIVERDPRFSDLRSEPRFRAALDGIETRIAEQRRAVEADAVNLPVDR